MIFPYRDRTYHVLGRRITVKFTKGDFIIFTLAVRVHVDSKDSKDSEKCTGNFLTVYYL